MSDGLPGLGRAEAGGDSYTFLLVEDSEDDALLLRLALAKAKIANPIQLVASGEEAIAYFSGAGEYSNRQKYPLPALVFMDLNLPGMGGLQVMKWLQGQIHLRHIRVVALSSSPDARCFYKVRELGADGSFSKTHDYQDVIAFVRSFCKLSQLVQPPPDTARFVQYSTAR